MKTFDVPLNKLVSIATDGAPAMLGKNICLIGILRHDSQIPQFIPIHCLNSPRTSRYKIFKIS
jgi:hypothetical protein